MPFFGRRSRPHRRDRAGQDCSWKVCVGCGQPPTDTPCIHSANKQGNELKQQLRWPTQRATELAPSNRTCIRSAILNGLESRQRTIGSPWSSDGSAL